jgi:hypothetical protein
VRLKAFILVPILFSILAVGEGFAGTRRIASIPAHALAATLGSSPSDLLDHRPSAPPFKTPPSLESKTQENSVPASSDVPVKDHQTGQANPAGSPVPNALPQKKVPTSTRLALPARIESGGEDAATPTLVPSLPFADSSNTCAFRDDYAPPCVPGGGPDAVYLYSPQADGCIRASLCNSSFDTALYIALDSLTNIIACNDDFCGLSSELDNIPIFAGHNYYIIVDGFGNSCGNYNLLIDSCSAPPLPIACPPSATPEGEPTCYEGYVDYYDGGCNSSPPSFVDLACSTDTIRVCGTYGTYGFGFRDVDWYRVTINNTTTLHYCVTGQYQTSMLVLDGRNGCGGASVLAQAVGTPGQSACLNPTLGAGTYYLVVTSDAYSGVPCGSNYYMTLVADSCPPPPPPPVCPANAIHEGEPDCYDGYADNYDAGCNSDSLGGRFVELPCTAGTVSVCGTYGTYVSQGLQYRDTDWYQIVVNKTSSIEACVTGQYGTEMYVLDGRFGCGNIGLVCAQAGSADQPICCNATLGPGKYWVVVTTSAFSGQPCGGLYVMSVTRDSCPEPFVLACPATAGDEGEPVCHDNYQDTFDAGCNSDPPSFISRFGSSTGNTDCVPGTVQVCGTYGTYSFQGSQYRDTDWYQMIVNRTTHLRYCAVGEAATSIYVLNGTSGCSGLSFVCANSGAPGDSICCDVTLSAGTYWLFIASSDYFGVPCGSRYVISVTRDTCPEPFLVDCPHGATAEQEPVCSSTYVDHSNGGCNSNPPVFEAVRCSKKQITICGTYGTYQYQGIDFRDTDWYEIELKVARHVRFNVIGEAPTSVFILNGAAGCSNPNVESSASGARGDSIVCEADLLPGIHWFFVATSNFTGIPCGSRYVIMIDGYKCGDPSDVTGVPETAATGALAIHAIIPNPMTGASRIDYELPHESMVRLEVYNIAGQRVRTVVDQRRAPGGIHSASWDGRNDDGRRLPAGAYFVRLTTGSRFITDQLMLVR